MKKLLPVFFLIALFLGCGGAAQRSEFWEHNTMYRTNDHLRFSWAGYKNPTQETMGKSLDQNWWGIETPYVPGQ